MIGGSFSEKPFWKHPVSVLHGREHCVWKRSCLFTVLHTLSLNSVSTDTEAKSILSKGENTLPSSPWRAQQGPGGRTTADRLLDTWSSGFLVFRTSQKLISIYKAKYRTAKSSKVRHGLPSGLSLICWVLLTLKKEKKTLQKSHIRRLAPLLIGFFNTWLLI